MNIDERLRQMGVQRREAELPSQDDWDRFRARAHGRLVRRKVGVVLAAAVVAVAVVAGVQGAGSLLKQDAALLPPAGDEDAPGEKDTPPVDDGDANESTRGLITMQTWYAQSDLLYLDHQFIEPPPASASERAPADRVALMESALKQVLGGPSVPVAETTAPSVRTAFSPATRLNRLDLGRRTTVDLSGFPDGFSAGDRSLALAQVAATVLQYEDVNSVEILDDGAPLTEVPLTEASYERLLPPIVVTEPPYAEHPKSFVESLTMEGTANVFEATVVYELVDRDGEIIADGFTTATCGSGCRGDFSKRMKFEVAIPTFAKLNVYSPSAEDGSRVFEVSVPVYLCPAVGNTVDRIGDDPYATCGTWKSRR